MQINQITASSVGTGLRVPYNILIACPSALASAKYTWRLSNVLRVIAEAVEQRLERVNAEHVAFNTKHFIAFMKKGFKSRPQSSYPRDSNYIVAAGYFVKWSTSSQKVIIVELTVPWEDNIDDAH